MAVEFDWMHLLKARYFAVASVIPPNFNPGPQLADTFLTAFVYNFPNDYAGPANKVAVGNPMAVYGIWNGATVMSIEFDQRVDDYEIDSRIPVYEGDLFRCYGSFGAFLLDLGTLLLADRQSGCVIGDSVPTDVGLYTNIVSNRMYGPHIGTGSECYLGCGVSVSLDLDAAMMLDVVKERATYETGQKFFDPPPVAKRNITDYTFVPELKAEVNLWWYPIEGVQLRFGYDVMAFFDTIAAQDPVSFNYGGLDPPYARTFRFFDGLQMGIALIF